jgi:hypothetical protein
MDDDTDGGPRLADLISEPEDVPKIRERVKALAKQARDRGEDATVDDFLAQSRKNDAAYIAPVDLEKAEWIAEIYDQEGRPETHPRNFHYQILGKGYEKRDGEPYTASNSSWTELKEAFKWARIIGLVDSSRILDAANPHPKPTAFDDVDRPLPQSGERTTQDATFGIDVDDGFRSASIPDEIELAKTMFDDAEEFIETAAQMISRQAFERIYFDATAEQRYYIEIWSEKSGVIPEGLAAEYGATIRESGKGEFSLSMCEKAVDLADTRNQDLALVIISDHDPKGSDMPISASRKAEVLGALHDVEIEVVQAAVTKQQVAEYGIPGDPAKIPDGLEEGVRGAKGYETQKEVFREYAGQYPVEIQAFSTRYPDAFADEIEQCVRPYYDVDLGERIKQNVADAREEARQILVDAFEDHREEIADALGDLQDGLDRYHDQLEGNVEAAMEGLRMLDTQEQAVREAEGLDDLRAELVETIEAVDHREILAEVDVPLPNAEASGASDPLLDTRRSFMAQLRAYRRFNVRYND